MLQECVGLAHRPRRRRRGVAMQPPQRLDPQVAVDQHQPLALGDHHHRHLLADLGHRRDQPAAPRTVADPQIVVPQLQLVQVDVHLGTLPELPGGLHLGLRRWQGMSAEFTRNIHCLSSYLVLHERPDYLDYSRKDHATFYLHLVLHPSQGTPASGGGACADGGADLAPAFDKTIASCHRRARS